MPVHRSGAENGSNHRLEHLDEGLRVDRFAHGAHAGGQLAHLRELLRREAGDGHDQARAHHTLGGQLAQHFDAVHVGHDDVGDHDVGCALADGHQRLDAALVHHQLRTRQGFVDEQGEDLARQFNSAFLEVSAKTRHNVDLIFHNLIQQINKQSPPKTAKKGGKKSCMIL